MFIKALSINIVDEVPALIVRCATEVGIGFKFVMLTNIFKSNLKPLKD